MTSPSVILASIATGLFYVLPRTRFEVLPRKINVVLEGGLVVTAICRRKHGSQEGEETNMLFDIMGAVASSASAFIIGRRQAGTGI